MKIAGVSMTFNDGYKLTQWREHYETYKNQIDIFVIVDNGSDATYLAKLEKTFPEAVILRRTENGGCTAAYNDGIRYVLEHTDAQAIAILGNDIKVTKKCIPAMYEYLFSDEKLGIVSTAILNINSNIIDNYGHQIGDFSVICCDRGKNIEDITNKSKYTDLVTGGFTMAKRAFYEKCGLQDEALFMYCDELDTAFKAKKNGFKIGVIASEYAWHWHINPPSTGKRSSASRYLISRNRIYLAKKYRLKGKTAKQIVMGFLVSPVAFVVRYLKTGDSRYLTDAKYSMIGVLHGLRGEMYTNKYTKF